MKPIPTRATAPESRFPELVSVGRTEREPLGAASILFLWKGAK